MLKRRLVVIYNPFSGKNKVRDLPSLIQQHIDHNQFEVQIWPTEKPEDLHYLTERAIKEAFDIVVAAGGDGTINQIASRLVNTSVVLGIIPLGSGNGFARHFKLPLNTIKAIQNLAFQKEKLIDTVWFDRHCMINIGGFGFDAQISAAFAGNKKRGLQGYVKTILKHLNYKAQTYSLYKDNQLIWEGKAFMIGIANATQWGNNVYLYPGAKPDDGLFNVLVVKAFSGVDFFKIVGNLLQRRLHMNEHSELFTGTDFEVVRKTSGPVHVDGEPLWLGQKVEIRIEPLSLKILQNE